MLASVMCLQCQSTLGWFSVSGKMHCKGCGCGSDYHPDLPVTDFIEFCKCGTEIDCWREICFACLKKLMAKESTIAEQEKRYNGVCVCGHIIDWHAPDGLCPCTYQPGGGLPNCKCKSFIQFRVAPLTEDFPVPPTSALTDHGLS